jgi:undecaprenol kinase/diacylglycerol kinase (ATP)
MERRATSFKFALAGWWYVIRTQPNARIHLVISAAVIVVATWLKLAPGDWALLFLTMAFVWMAEMANTAMEAVVDLLSPDYQQEAKIAKDISAGAVLLSAFGAAVVGVLIIGPPLYERIFSN